MPVPHPPVRGTVSYVQSQGSLSGKATPGPIPLPLPFCSLPWSRGFQDMKLELKGIQGLQKSWDQVLSQLQVEFRKIELSFLKGPARKEFVLKVGQADHMLPELFLLGEQQPFLQGIQALFLFGFLGLDRPQKTFVGLFGQMVKLFELPFQEFLLWRKIYVHIGNFPDFSVDQPGLVQK